MAVNTEVPYEGFVISLMSYGRGYGVSAPARAAIPPPEALLILEQLS